MKGFFSLIIPVIVMSEFAGLKVAILELVKSFETLLLNPTT